MSDPWNDVRRREAASADGEPGEPGESEALFELVLEAVRLGLAEADGATRPLSRRMVGGTVVFRDAEGRDVKETDAGAFFKKVTSVREKLRVLEQKINNHDGLDAADKADLQVYITRCYGSLTTFNFLFRDEADRFRGSGS